MFDNREIERRLSAANPVPHLEPNPDDELIRTVLSAPRPSASGRGRRPVRMLIPAVAVLGALGASVAVAASGFSLELFNSKSGPATPDQIAAEMASVARQQVTLPSEKNLRVTLDRPVKLASWNAFAKTLDLYAAAGTKDSFCVGFYEGTQNFGGGCSTPLDDGSDPIPYMQTSNSGLGSGQSQGGELSEDGPVAIAGNVPSGASALYVHFEDGTRAQVATRDGLFGYVVGGSHQVEGSRPVALIATDAKGRQVARDRLSPGEYEAH
jgi:hypothetical protein